jgi:transcriptional regulator with XRE-family HTH domain
LRYREQMTFHQQKTANFRGERMAAWRAMRNITQAELARGVGIGRTQITMLEGGETEPSMLVLMWLAMTLDVTTDWLLGLTDVPTEGADSRYPNWRHFMTF